jgi:hypothetical protein
MIFYRISNRLTPVIIYTVSNIVNNGRLKSSNPGVTPDTKTSLALAYNISSIQTHTGQNNYLNFMGSYSQFAVKFTGMIPAIFGEIGIIEFVFDEN